MQSHAPADRTDPARHGPGPFGVGTEAPGRRRGPGPAPLAPGGGPSLVVEIPLGQRALVLGDLLLPAEPTPASRAEAADIAAILEDWQAPGVLIVVGNLFDTEQCADQGRGGGGRVEAEGRQAAASLRAHSDLTEAIASFTARPGCRLLVLPGWRDASVMESTAVAQALRELRIEVVPAVDLHLVTAAGRRRVLVRSGTPASEAQAVTDPELREARPWLTGLDRLEDPTASRRFVTSRLLYRRLRRYLWIPPLVVAVVALAIRLPFVFSGLNRVVRTGRGHRVLIHAYYANWQSRLIYTLLGIGVLLVVLGAVVALSSRGLWRALGGGDLPGPFRHSRDQSVAATGTSSTLTLPGGMTAIDEAREAVAAGASGLVTGGDLRAELTHLDRGFFACPGGSTELVREHPGRVGLPPVFLHHRQTSWIELETGADLHVRLLLAHADLPNSTFLERILTPDHIVKGYKAAAEVHPSMVASWPSGASWPPPADVAATRVRVRRVRRLAAGAIFIAGLVDLLSAVTRPLRAHLASVEHLLPLGAVQLAGALVAISGIALMMLARGVRRGQRRAWLVSVCLLTVTLILHVLHAALLSGLAVTGLVLVFLLVERQQFRAESDAPSSRSAFVTLGVGAVAATLAAFLAVEVTDRVHHHPLPAWPEVMLGSAERLVGLSTVAFPRSVNRVVSPSLLAVGIALVVVALYLLTRPVVDRRLSSARDRAARRGAELRARDIVRRHGTGTLDYFALRDDKQFFFHRDSLVAYAVYGGVALISPDPIGPISEREQVWSAFRHFADQHGWAIGVMAAGEEWLPVYRASGMHHLYIGDEAVVDVQSFSLNGGKMKGLRQAVNRVSRYGYTVHFADPARIPPREARRLADLMEHRRGENERGFSMMLGRLFDPRDTGLLLTVVNSPEGNPVAMCQFVPSPAIDGYSLDLMRRDPGEHPNGLLDFALCATIDHLRQRGGKGLSLNFAAMRSVLEGEGGDGVTQRVERWALRRLSGALQIESLWKFNAKYEPSWLPRYVVYDSAEQFVPTAVQIMRAESLTEIPVLGRFLNTASSGTTRPGRSDDLPPDGSGWAGEPGAAPGTRSGNRSAS